MLMEAGLGVSIPGLFGSGDQMYCNGLDWSFWQVTLGSVDGSLSLSLGALECWVVGGVSGTAPHD
jgi:hypothetical protein